MQAFHLKVSILHGIVILLLLLGCGCSSVPVPLVPVPKVPPMPKPIHNVNVALVLGGGGVRGLAHVGVLEVLEENKVPIDLIVGSSAGSIVGSLYADCPDAKLLKQKLLKLKRKDLIDSSIWNVFGPRLGGPIQGNLLQRYLIKNLYAQDFDELKIPFIAVATSLRTNKIYTFRSGPIVPAVHASSALPMLFTPVFMYNDIFIDGSVISPVPVSVARYFDPKIVIAVDISAPPSNRNVRNIFELAYRALHISYYEMSRLQSKFATVLIHPELGKFGTFEDNYNEEIYQIGRRAALEALPRIKKALSVCRSKNGCVSDGLNISEANSRMSTPTRH